MDNSWIPLFYTLSTIWLLQFLSHKYISNKVYYFIYHSFKNQNYQSVAFIWLFITIFTVKIYTRRYNTILQSRTKNTPFCVRTMWYYSDLCNRDHSRAYRTGYSLSANFPCTHFHAEHRKVEIFCYAVNAVCLFVLVVSVQKDSYMFHLQDAESEQSLISVAVAPKVFASFHGHAVGLWWC